MKYCECTQNAHFQTPKKGRVLGTGARFGYNIGMAKRGRVLGTGARFGYRGVLGTGVELIKVTNMVINRYSGVLFLLK